MRAATWVVAFAVLGAAPLHAQQDAILGTWRGTSTCVKEDWNSACNDEQVVYQVTRVPNQPDSVSVDAAKLVNGKPEPMGTIVLGYDASAKRWSGEWSNSRYHLLWSFQVSGTALTGTLVLLPSRQVARNISARKG